MRRRTLALAAVALAGGVLVVPAATGAPAPSLGAGCDPKRPAVAHHSGGAVLKPQPKGAPIPCGVSTGFGGAESHIVVTKSGAVVFTPAVVPAGGLGTGEGPDAFVTQSNASPAGLAVSKDRGATWQLVKPNGITWNPTDHGDYVDPVTGRLFFEDYGPIPLAAETAPYEEGHSHMMWSDDDGKSWFHTVIPELFLTENPRYTSAVPPRGQPKPTGYPNVVYFCANTNVGFTSPVIAARQCYRSLDGGSTWDRAAELFRGTVPVHPECGSNPEQYSAIDGYYPQPTRDGSLYVMVSCGPDHFLARSTDEAESFPVILLDEQEPLSLPVPEGSGPDLRIDSDDVMYLAYQVGPKLLLRTSRDYGRHWGPELDLTPPGVARISQWAFAQRGRGGHVAFSMLAQKAGQTSYDGYLTETRNALTRKPVFWSAIVNDPRRPLLYAESLQGSGYLTLPGGQSLPLPAPFGPFPVATGNDFIGAVIAPDGTPWGSWTQDCGPAPDSPGCVAQAGQTRGFAGRLRWR